LGRSSKKPALGKGLDSILRPHSTIGTNPKDIPAGVIGRVVHLSPNKINVNPRQPRKNFNSELIEQLAQSIKLHGLIQPITVRKINLSSNYELISGERRLKAAKLVDLKTIPCYVRTAQDKQLLEFALIENIHRKDLNPIEIGLTFQRLLQDLNFTHHQLGQRLAKNRTSITNYIRLLKLPDIIQLGLRDNKISFGHGRALLAFKDQKTQINLFNDIISQNLSVRDVEKLIIKPKSIKEPTLVTKNPFVESSTQKLNAYFDTTVDLKLNKKGSGYIRIPFKSKELLQTILNKISDEK